MNNNISIISKGNKTIVPIVDINDIIMDDNIKEKLSSIDDFNNIFRQSVSGIPIQVENLDDSYDTINGNILINDTEYIWTMLPNMLRSTTYQSSTGDNYPINIASINNIDYLLDNVWTTKSTTGNLAVTKYHKSIGKDITSILNVGGTSASGYQLPSIYNGTAWSASTIPLEVERHILTGTPESGLFAYGGKTKSDGLFGIYSSYSGFIGPDNYIRFIGSDIDNRLDAMSFGTSENTIVTGGKTSTGKNHMMTSTMFNGDVWSYISSPNIIRMLGGASGKSYNGFLYGPDPFNITHVQSSEIYNGEYWRTTGDVNIDRAYATSSGLGSSTYLGGNRPHGDVLVYLSAEQSIKTNNNVVTVKTKGSSVYNVLDGINNGSAILETTKPLAVDRTKTSPVIPEDIGIIVDDVDYSVAKNLYINSTNNIHYDLLLGDRNIPVIEPTTVISSQYTSNVHYPKNTKTPIVVESDIDGNKKTFNVRLAEKTGVWRVSNSTMLNAETNLKSDAEGSSYLGTISGKIHLHSGRVYNASGSIPTGGVVTSYGNTVSGIYDNILVFGGQAKLTNAYNGITTKWSDESHSFVNTANYISPRSYLTSTGLVDASLGIGGIYNGTILNTTDFYNGTVWSTLTGMSTARESHSSIGNVDSALTVGGRTATAITDKSEIFNGATWSNLSNIPIKIKKATLNGKAYDALLSAGEDASGYQMKSFRQLGDIWYTVGDVNIPRTYHSASGTSTNAKLIGGISNVGSTIHNETFSAITNLSLSELKCNGTRVPNFNPNKKSYTIDIYDDIVPTITAETLMGSIVITPASSITGVTTINITSGELTDTVYVRFNKLKITLDGIKINNVPMDIFRKDINEYNIDILSGDVVNVEPIVSTPFTATVSGTNPRIIDVKWNDVVVNTYTVNITNVELNLSAIIINNSPISDFNSNTFNYVYNIAEGESIPTINGVYASDKLDIEIFNTTDISTKSYIKVGFDGREVFYYITYNVVSLSLSNIYVNGVAIDNFSPSIYEYDVSIASMAIIPTVTFNSSPALSITKIDAGNIYNPTTIEVEFRGYKKKYTINWIPIELTLTEIKYGNTKVSRFKPDIYQYTLNIAEGETIPQLSCTTSSEYISYTIENAVDPKGTSTIVLSLGGYTRRYEIKWNVISLKLAEVYIAGKPLTNFSPTVDTHIAAIAEGSEKPSITVRLVNTLASFRYQHIENSPSELIVSYRGIEKIYYIQWSYVNIGLRNIYLNGVQLEGVSKDILTYNFNVDTLTYVESITIDMEDDICQKSISTSFNGDVAVTYITISYGYSTKIYKVIWQKYDLLLSSLAIDGYNLMNFDPTVKNYIYNISDQESYADITPTPKYDFVNTSISHGTDYSTITLSYGGNTNTYRVTWNVVSTQIKNIEFYNNGKPTMLVTPSGIYEYKIKVAPQYQLSIAMANDAAQYFVNTEYSGGYYKYETITTSFRGYSRVYRITVAGQGKPHVSEITEFSCDCMLSQNDGNVSYNAPVGSGMIITTPVSSELGIPNINVSSITFNYSSLIAGDNMLLGVLYVKLTGGDIEKFTGISETSTPLTIRSLVKSMNFTPKSSQYLMTSTFMKQVSNMNVLSIDTIRSINTILDPSIKVGITSTEILNTNRIVNCQFVIQSPDWEGNGTKTIVFKKYN